MSEIPSDLLYTKDHEWLRLHDDGTATVGITDYAQESLGDITFVEFPSVGDVIDAESVFGVVESVKAASDLYMPVKAEVVEINDEVDSAPELLNQEPYTSGWILKVKILDEAALATLLKPADYEALV